MNQKFPPIRRFIQQTIKTFPWSYEGQESAFAAFSDLLIADRAKSFNAYVRAGMDDITVRKFCYAFSTGEIQTKYLSSVISDRYNKIDKRCSYSISVDDTSIERYGDKVYGASVHHNHAISGYEYGNVFVDVVTTAKNYYFCDYKTYLSKKWLEKEDIPLSYLETKIQLGKELFDQQITTLQEKMVPNSRIWCTCDSWFGNKNITQVIEEKGVNYIVGVRKNLICNLFGNEKNLEEVFSLGTDWKWIKSPYSSKKIFYKQKILNLKQLGRKIVFALKRGKETRIRYYVSNHLKLTIQTFCRKWQRHWAVESLHDYLKNSFALDECHSGREITNCTYWNFTYAINLMFQLYVLFASQNNLYYTIQQLVEAYSLDYDIEKAKKCFSSAKRIESSKRKLVKGWC